jgi:hypothetical protein
LIFLSCSYSQHAAVHHHRCKPVNNANGYFSSEEIGGHRLRRQQL